MRRIKKLNKNQRLFIESAKADPSLFVREWLGARPWSKQEEIINSLVSNSRTAVRSAHATGKSWLAARAVLWWMGEPGSVALTTAPTFRQVRNVLWQEIRMAHSGSKQPLSGRMLTTALRIKDGWYALGFSTNDPNAFQGLHSAKRVLVVFDEAAGVDRSIWDSAEGVLTTDSCRMLSIGNPTDTAGRFFDEFKNPGTNKIKISAYDTPNFTEFGIVEEDIASGEWQKKIKGPLPYPSLVSPGWVADKYKRWGNESPFYRSRVLAEFPQSSSDALIPLHLVEAAMLRESEVAQGAPTILGVDVARFGGDKSIILARRGARARVCEKIVKTDTMTLTGKVVMHLDESKAVKANIDVIGIGSGVFDRLNELGRPAVAANAGGSPVDKERFLNARAEWYWTIREDAEAGNLDIDDEDLAAQLASIKWKPTSRGLIQIESKEGMKARQMASPNEADALALTYAKEAPAPVMEVGRLNLLSR